MTMSAPGGVPAIASRAAALAVAVVAALLLTASPASAHGRGTDATNYDSSVTAAPDVPGAQWRVHGGDELLELTSPEVEVTVLGYSGEPYLRVGPDGVQRNTRSPATYLNEERYRVELPADANADPDAEPQWERIRDEPSFAWHDHRVHAMTTELPQRVAEDPSQPRLVQEWEVPIVTGGDELAVAGELRWVPGPSPWPWLLAGVIAALPALLGLRRADMRGLARPAALVLAIVALLNLSRIADDLVLPLPAGTIALAVLQTALFIAIGLAGAWKGWRGGDGAATALGVGAAAILFGQGIPFFTELSSSQLSSMLPDPPVRLIAAASLGQALTVGAVAVIGNRRMRPDDVEGAEPARPGADAAPERA